MKLVQIRIQNFRCITGEGNVIDFSQSDVIFLFGQNNAGKSSILTAYEYLVSPNQKAEISDFHKYFDGSPIVLEAIFEKEAGDDEAFTKLEKWVDDQNLVRIKKEWHAAGEKGQKFSWNPKTREFEENGFGGMDTIFTKHAPTAVRIPAMPTQADLTKWIKKVVNERILSKIKEIQNEKYLEAVGKLRDLQIALKENNVIRRLNEDANQSFQKVFPGLSISIDSEHGQELDLAKTLDSEFSLMIIDPRIPDANQNFDRHGHGVIRQAMFNILGIVKSKNDLPIDSESQIKKSFIILFEEPEIYLHPKAIKLLRSAIYELAGINSPFQILCASHEPGLIDISKDHVSLVRIVREENGVTHFHQVGENVFSKEEYPKDWLQMINRFNPFICESFFSENVVIVEGDTEAIIVRELLSHFAPERDIFVLNAGSKTNIPFFQEIFSHFRITHSIIHDSDTQILYESNGYSKPKLTATGEKWKNAAWVHNETIWEKLEVANQIHDGMARRFVLFPNFEEAHDYSYDSKNGKPLSAFRKAIEILKMEDNTKVPIVKYILQIIGKLPVEKDYTPEEVANLMPH